MGGMVAPYVHIRLTAPVSIAEKQPGQGSSPDKLGQ